MFQINTEKPKQSITDVSLSNKLELLVNEFEKIPSNLKTNNKIKIYNKNYDYSKTSIFLTKHGYEILYEKRKYLDSPKPTEPKEAITITPKEFLIKLQEDWPTPKKDSYDYETSIKEFVFDRINSLYKIIDVKTDVSDIINEPNFEIRNVLIKKLGWDSIKDHVNIIDEFDDYVLFDLYVKNRNLGRFLKMNDSSTNREYLLQIPPRLEFGVFNVEINKCLDAVAWSFGMQTHEYKPELET